MLERLDARFVFVVGKGGVGKTTTAGALALASADADTSTHLVSTDPAHSVGDLFSTSLPAGKVVPSACSSLLSLEELDPAGYAAEWIAGARAPLLELFDRGTYLEAEDVAGFLDLSLPGVDEIAAVLRLSALAADAEPRRIVVDTAPTGHTLRLLDAPGVLERWTRAFAAMEEKAVAVISGITRRDVRLAAATVIRDLEARVQRFQSDVLAAGEAVVVERTGTLVEAESARLRDELRERGLHIAARVLTEAPDAPAKETAPTTARRKTTDRNAGAAADSAPIVRIPWREGLAGCGGLRKWGERGSDAAKPRASSTKEAPAAPWIRSLDVELMLFAGKGGVGKTTCAAAAAMGLSGDKRVVLLGTDPAGSLADVLQQSIPPEGAMIAGVRVREIQAGAEFERFRETYRKDVEDAFARIGASDSLALDRRVVASLLELAPPGADEIFAVLALLDEVGKDSVLVIDAAPTGHLLRLLEMPRLALDWVHQLMRVLIKYRAALGLDAFAERLLVFAKQLKDLNLRLHDPERTAAFVVSLPGPLVAAETRRLEARLEEGGVREAARLLNRSTGAGEKREDAEPAQNVALVRVPLLDPSPLRPEGLSDFFQRWTLAS